MIYSNRHGPPGTGHSARDLWETGQAVGRPVSTRDLHGKQIAGGPFKKASEFHFLKGHSPFKKSNSSAF